MSDITRPIQQIETEINILKVQTAQNIIEIGKRLIEAKAQLQHGEWLPWLRDKVEFSQQTASNFIRVANEFGNYQTLGNLNPAKLYALLDVSSDDRQSFIEEKHEVGGEEKTIDEMTTRELQAAIKAKKEADEKIKQLENKLQNEMLKKDEIISELRGKSEEVTVIEKIVEKIPDDYEQIKKEKQNLAEQNKSLLEQKQQLARQVQETKSLTTELISIDEFRTNIGYFLDKMAKYTYYAEAFGMFDKRQQTEFLKLVEKIDIWCTEVKQSIKGEKSEKTIIFEGGFIDVEPINNMETGNGRQHG